VLGSVIVIPCSDIDHFSTILSRGLDILILQLGNSNNNSNNNDDNKDNNNILFVIAG
jgi:hypothetical protein